MSFLSLKFCHGASLLAHKSPNSLNMEPKTSSFCSREPRWESEILPLRPHKLLVNSDTHTPQPPLWSLFSAHWSGTTITATLILNQNALQARLSLREPLPTSPELVKYPYVFL